jgi:hypothetical protein
LFSLRLLDIPKSQAKSAGLRPQQSGVVSDTMASGSSSWRELSSSAKVFVAAVVLAGSVVLLCAVANPTSENIAKFICYLLVAILASRLKVHLPGITGTMSVNFLFIILGILEEFWS